MIFVTSIAECHTVIIMLQEFVNISFKHGVVSCPSHEAIENVKTSRNFNKL